MAEGGRSILVVDDDPDVCWALKKVLSEAGVTVEAVASGHEALVRLRDAQFQLLLLDVKLPDIDGIELVRQIHAEYGGAPPVILVSGYYYSDDALIQECMQRGLVRAFVTKPFSHEYLREVVGAVLRRGPHTTR